DALFSVEGHLRFVLSNLDFFLPRDFLHRTVEQVQVAFNRNRNYSQATVAGAFQHCTQVAPDVNLHTDQFRHGVQLQVANLAELSTMVVERSGGVSLRNRDPMELKLFQCDEHDGLGSPKTNYSRLAWLVKEGWPHKDLQSTRLPVGRRNPKTGTAPQ